MIVFASSLKKMGLSPFPANTPAKNALGNYASALHGEVVTKANRTTDTRIFNPLLYQLSYLAEFLIVSIADSTLTSHRRIDERPTVEGRGVAVWGSLTLTHFREL